MNQIQQVTKWIDAAKQEPSLANEANYVGYILSEVGEMLKTISKGDHFELERLANRLEEISMDFRSGDQKLMCFLSNMYKKDKAKLMDDAFDIAWTSIGLMHMLGDAEGSFEEGSASNYSKFENGVCALDETGKVVKPPSFFQPDFYKFIR